MKRKFYTRPRRYIRINRQVLIILRSSSYKKVQIILFSGAYFIVSMHKENLNVRFRVIKYKGNDSLALLMLAILPCFLSVMGKIE